MEDITFNLKHTIFHKDLYDYKKKTVSALGLFLYPRNLKIKRPLSESPYCSQDERPYKCNDKYNKIILALRYDRNINQVSEHNPINLNEKYHKFLVQKRELDTEIKEGINDVISDYCKIEEPTRLNRSDKKPKLIGRRKIEKAFADYIEKKLIDIKSYYDECKEVSDELKKERIKNKMYEDFNCECGYKGKYAHKNRHLKTTLHIKRLLNKLENEEEE